MCKAALDNLHRCLIHEIPFQVDSPPFWTVEEWCEGFRNLLTHLDLVLPLSPLFQKMLNRHLQKSMPIIGPS